MTSRIVWFLILIALLAGFSLPRAEYGKLDSAREVTLPRDHYAHQEFRTEWWYFNGFLGESSDPEYAFHLAFFVRRTESDLILNMLPIRWLANPVHLAHFSLIDLSNGEVLTAQKRNRDHQQLGGSAGASSDKVNVWNEDWHYREENGEILIEVADSQFALSLTLNDTKPAVLHGDAGIFVKAEYEGKLRGSYYISRPRLSGVGSLQINGRNLGVRSQVWMDHEFGSYHLAPEQTGWNWFSLMFDDNSELVLYLLKDKNGSLSKRSIGTWVNPDGTTRSLSFSDIKTHASIHWQSAKTGTNYPVAWQVSIEPLDLQFEIDAIVHDLEFDSAKSTRVTYWEGPVTFTGEKAGMPVKGYGFQELTGNLKPLTELSH